MTRCVGVLTPLQRDGKTDFAHGSGLPLAEAKVRQVFSTLGSSPLGPGELAWNTDFGSGLHTLKHAKQNSATVALARVYVEDAFAHWLPELKLIDANVTFLDRGIKLSVSFRDTNDTHQLDFYIGAPAATSP